MSEFLPQQVTLACPVCGTPIQTKVYHLVDVGLEPELKAQLLRGRINVARCVNCGGEGVIAAPIMYHDPGKELLLAFIPPEMELRDEQRQQMIGSITNLILGYLPPEERKGYLLVPKELLSYQSFLETILQAEGVTSEAMAAQRVRMDLIERLRRELGREENMQNLVAEVDEQLNFEFFATLGAYIEANRQDGQEDRARELEGLRERLLELSTYGRKVVAQMLEGPPDQQPLSREDLLEKLLATTTGEELTELVTWYRSGVDYAFFQLLTAQMEAAEQEGRAEAARRLRNLRETLLKIVEKIDQETRLALEKAAGLLRRLLGAPDVEAFVRQHLDEFDDAFFIVLGSNLQAAKSAGQEEVRQQLQELGSLVLQIAQERLPPEVRLIRLLLTAPDDETAQGLVQEHAALVNERLVELMRDLAKEITEETTARRLQHLADLAEQWLRE